MTDFASFESYNSTQRLASLALSPDGTRLVTVVASAERARTDLGWKPERADITGIVRDAWEFTRARHGA